MRELLALEERLAEAWPPAAWRDVSVLISISGGPDSVALLRAMSWLKQEAKGEGRLIAGHVNHGLRAEADRDEAFVRALAQQLEVACDCSRLDPSTLDTRDGWEAAAREARYERLSAMAQRHGARYVATGHTADDQAETILHRIVRGTGLAGLAGMPRTRSLSPAVTLLRPMLGLSRAEVMAYLAELGQPYCLDATNEETRLTRNRIRHDLIPLLERQFNPQAKQALLRLGSLAAEAQGVIEALIDELRTRCVRIETADEMIIDCRPLSHEPRYLVRELFARIWRIQGWPQQAMGYEEWNRLAIWAAVPGQADDRQDLPGHVSVARRGSTLRLRMAHS